MNKKNEFLLPDELGWDCNDEISNYIDKWRRELLKYYQALGNENLGILWETSKAQLMDNIYSIIKKYQLKETK